MRAHEVYAARLASGKVPAERQPDGSVIVREVPIFAEVLEGDPAVAEGAREARDRAWLERALRKHEERRALGQLPALTLRHSTDPKGAERCGTYRLTKVDRAEVNPGEERWVLFGDLELESLEAFERARSYDYRSAEVSRDAPGELAAVALLRDAMPYHRFPNIQPELAPELVEAFAAVRSRGGQTWKNEESYMVQTHEQSRAETSAQATAADVSAGDMVKGGRLAAMAIAYSSGGSARADCEKMLLARCGREAAAQARAAWKEYVFDPTSSGHSWVQRFAALFPTLAADQTPATTPEKPIPAFPESVDRGVGDQNVRLVPDGSRTGAPVEDDDDDSTASKLARAKRDLARMQAGLDPSPSVFEAARVGVLGLDVETFGVSAPLHGKDAIAANLRAAQRELEMHEALADRAARVRSRGEAPGYRKALEAFGARPEARLRIEEFNRAWLEADDHQRAVTPEIFSVASGDARVNPAILTARGGRGR